MQLLFLSQWFSDEMLKAMSWTLVHSLWQGLLAAVIAGLIIISTKRTSARLRYNLLGGLLVLFLLTVAFTMRQQVASIHFAEPVANRLSLDDNNVFTNIADEPGQLSVPATGSAGRMIKFLNDHADLIMLVWTMFFLFHCIKIFTGVAGIRRLRTSKTHTADEWQTKLNHLSKAIGIYQSVRLLQSELIRVPVAIGFFKPVILIPLGLLSHLPPDQVETILLHELAHIRRRDYVVNILQRFAEAIFFFNPALLWISSLIRQEREACCDDIVVANTTHKGSYLEALVSFQEYSLTTSAYAMGISSKKHYLLNRVKRMLTRENKKLDLMEKILLIIGVTVVSAFTFMPKKEAAAQQQQPVRQSVKRTEEKPETGSLTTPSSAIVTNQVPAHKMTTHKELVKPGFKPVILRDTVPPKTKEKEENNSSSSNSNSSSSSSSSNNSNEEPGFQSISSNVNNDGKTKTSTTTVVDQNGKKYIISRLNDKITSFSINGNTIPENEINQYSSLIGKIDQAVENRNEERRKQQQIRKEENTRRNEERRVKQDEDMKRRTEERRVKQDENTKRRIEEQNKQQAMNAIERSKMREKIEKERKGKDKDNEDRKREKEMEKRKEDIEKHKREIERENDRRMDEMQRKKEDLDRRRKELEKDDNMGKDEMKRKKEDLDRRRKEIEKENDRRKDEIKRKEEDIEKREKEIEKEKKTRGNLFSPKSGNSKLFMKGREVVQNQDKSADGYQPEYKKDFTKQLLNHTELKLDVNQLVAKTAIKPHAHITLVTDKKIQLNNDRQLKKTVELSIIDIKLTDKKLPTKSDPSKQTGSPAIPVKGADKKMPAAPKPKAAAKFEYSPGVVT